MAGQREFPGDHAVDVADNGYAVKQVHGLLNRMLFWFAVNQLLTIKFVSRRVGIVNSAGEQ